MFAERVDFDLPVGQTARSILRILREGSTKAVEYTRGGEIVHAGTVSDFSIELDGAGAEILSGTVYSDDDIDFDITTFTVTGVGPGTLTVNVREKTVLLPLIF